MPAAARVSLKRRPRPLGDLGRTYDVVIDDAVVDGIRRGETRSYDLVPGTHRIHLTIDGWRSRELDLAGGDTVELACSARSPLRGTPILHPTDYMALEIVDRTYAAGSAPAEPPLAEPDVVAEPQLAPGAPDDERMLAAWNARVESSERTAALRRALQAADASHDASTSAEIRGRIPAALDEHARRADEYRRLKALRPDWQSPRPGA